MTSFVSKNLPIYIDSGLQITLFLVGITKITYFPLITWHGHVAVSSQGIQDRLGAKSANWLAG